jgi:hypothetical protein
MKIPITAEDVATDTRSAKGGVDLRGLAPESWCCVDCGVNTAPGFFNRVELERALAAAGKDGGVEQRVGVDSEVYTVRTSVWLAAGIEPFGGCLCVGCLEKRLGRRLKPKDFLRGHPFNKMPGSARLMERMGRL